MRIDWAGLMRAGMGRQEDGGLGMLPSQFWALTPVELKLMLGLEAQAAPMDRDRLAELVARFPDMRKGETDGRP
jgi:uncharacterized phage protein (TIGR02216 family)